MREGKEVRLMEKRNKELKDKIENVRRGTYNKGKKTTKQNEEDSCKGNKITEGKRNRERGN